MPMPRNPLAARFHDRVQRGVVIGTALFLICAVVAGCGWSGASIPMSHPRQHPVVLSPGSVTEIPYLRVGVDDQTQGRLFLPRSHPTRPATVVLIHGGGWKAGVDSHALDALASQLQSRGVTVWNIEYRRIGSGGGWDTTFTDVAHAIDFIPELARATPLVNPEDVVVVGHSAGGQLAVWSASRAVRPTDGPGPPPRVVPRAAISLAGVLDMAATGRISTNARDVLGGDRRDVPRRYALVNPIERINPAVPVTIVHAVDDRVVRYSVGADYATAARKLGASVTTVALRSGGHAAPVTPGRGMSATLRAIDKSMTSTTGPWTVGQHY